MLLGRSIFAFVVVAELKAVIVGDHCDYRWYGSYGDDDYSRVGAAGKEKVEAQRDGDEVNQKDAMEKHQVAELGFAVDLHRLVLMMTRDSSRKPLSHHEVVIEAVRP